MIGLAACSPPRTVAGKPSTPASPPADWNPPTGAGAPLGSREAAKVARGSAVSPDVWSRRAQFTLADVIDVALSSSPQTRATWAEARAASASYGSARGAWMPTLDATATGGPVQAISQNPARIPPSRTTITTALSLQYSLLDFGRPGSVTAAREALFAADLTHNAAVQSVVLEAQTSYFVYQAARGLHDAARKSVETARINLDAADRRHEVGLATIADVLQARTALSQSILASQTAEGNVQAARARLALALGLPANTPFDVAPDSGATPIVALAENVDSLIAKATRDRPDVAAARALARESEARIRTVRGSSLPSLTFGATTGRNYSNIQTLEGQTYALNFGLSVPLFHPSRDNDVFAAQELAASALQRAEQVRLEAVAQVFTSYYGLQTATQRVTTSAELLTSATQSEEVARGRYVEGVGTILDLLAAQTVLADARAQSVESRWTWYASLAQLARDVGVLGRHGEPNLTLTADPARRR